MAPFSDGLIFGKLDVDVYMRHHQACSLARTLFMSVDDVNYCLFTHCDTVTMPMNSMQK